MTPAVLVDNLYKSFRGSMALRNVNWLVEPGSIHGLLGSNGAGKTTLLRLVLGGLWPDQGNIKVLGETLGRENARLRQRVHYVAAGRLLPQGFRVGEWVRYAELLYSHWDPRQAERLLEALELDSRSTISQLSTGMQMSLKLAVAIAARPDLLLLDEPTNGLDMVVKRQVLRLIIDMAADQGTTVVIATHNVEDIERMADSVSILYRGRMVLAGSIDEVKAHLTRLTVIIPSGWPSPLTGDPRIVGREHYGQSLQLTLQGPAEPIIELLRDSGAIHIESVSMDLSDIFTATLKKEGYTREAVAWPSL